MYYKIMLVTKEFNSTFWVKAKDETEAIIRALNMAKSKENFDHRGDEILWYYNMLKENISVTVIESKEL